VKMGTAGGEAFGGNAQEALRGDADDHWLLINHVGYVYGSSSAPSAGTDWTKLWSPTATPPVPEDFEDRYAADGTLCDSDVSTGEAPAATQNVYISEDLGLAMFPAGGLNQSGTAKPGVCISTDRGVTFYNVPFADLADLDISAPGPIAVTCLDNDDCFAYNGVDLELGSVYLYYTNNASAGKASVWHRATLPAGLDAGTDVNPYVLFFAPDKMHGWLAGANEENPMLLATTDGGHTWTNKSAAISALTDQRLHSGFAVDADHVFLGGEDGTLLYTDTASH
jgi:hypothetical protein